VESGQGVASTVSEQLEVTADNAVSAAESGTARLAGAVDSIEVPEADADLIGSASGEAAATGEVQAGEAVDAALESTLKGEVAGSINSTVQDDVRDSIQADLVTEITRSLPLPGRN
jgi:type IV secretory pathway VirB10-like protein